MSEPTPPRCEHRLVVGRSAAPSVSPVLWLEQGPGGWALPLWSSPEQRAADVAGLTRAASDWLGAEVSVLRCLSDLPAGEDGVRHQVHDLDVHGIDAAWSPAGPGRWFGAAEVESLPLARPEHGPVLTEWFVARWARREPPDGRDWVLPGWRDEVALWVDGQLSRHGLPPLARVEQVKAANVIATERGPVLIDWEDATLSHPFLSAYLLLTSLDYADAIVDKAAAHDRIRRAYLGPWREAWADRSGLAGGLERVFDLALLLAPLHHAVQFRLGLWRIERSWEVRAYVPLFLRRLLGGLPPRRDRV